MSEENMKNHTILKMLGIIIATFLGAFLAFYLAVDITISRMLSPEHNIKQMEKMMQHQERNFQKLEKNLMDNPFEPKLSPMLVNLIKENDEYKIIVDLKPLGGNEKNVNLSFDDNLITVSGKVEKNSKHNEQIMNFSQSFYTDEKLNLDTIMKEKKGDKFIITIPLQQ